MSKSTLEIMEQNAQYGVQETNICGNFNEWLAAQGPLAPDVENWFDPSVKEFVRVRLISDVDFPVWDLSYCYVRLTDGRVAKCHSIPGGNCLGQLRKSRYGRVPVRLSDAVEDAKRHGRFLKGMKFEEAISTLE